MIAIQIRAYGLLLACLLVVDAAAFHGAYRQEVGGRMLRALSAVSPVHWSAGASHDWRNAGRRRG